MIDTASQNQSEVESKKFLSIFYNRDAAFVPQAKTAIHLLERSFYA